MKTSRCVFTRQATKGREGEGGGKQRATEEVIEENGKARRTSEKGKGKRKKGERGKSESGEEIGQTEGRTGRNKETGRKGAGRQARM